MTRKRKTGELRLYIAIAVGIVLGGTLYEFLVPERLWPHLTYTWYMFIVETGFLYVFVMKMYWPHRGSSKLWMLLALLLTTHISGFAVLITRAGEFPAIVFFLAAPAEVMVVATVVKVCLDIMPAKVKL